MSKKDSSPGLYVYEFTGEWGPEDFPEPPIAKRLEPGDVVESETPIIHARLHQISGPPPPVELEPGPVTTEEPVVPVEE